MEHSIALVTCMGGEAKRLRCMGGEAKRLRAQAHRAGRRKRRKTYKIAEFVEGDSPVPSMFEPSGATVVRIDRPRIAALAL